MEKKEIVDYLNCLVKLSREVVAKETLNTNFDNKREVGYLQGYTEAMILNIDNLKVLIAKIGD